MISLLLNTKNRYSNLYEILKVEVDYKIVSEIIVFNNGDEDINFKHPKVRIVKANFDVGLRSRWILGVLARQNCLAVQDDDLIVDETIFDILHSNYLFDFDKLYGIYGRNIDVLGTYSTDNHVVGEADILLTRFACFDKSLIPYLIESEEFILPYRYPSALEFPYDDILLSYTATKVYNKKPYIVKIAELNKLIKELPDDNGLHKTPGFMEKRKSIISVCRSRLMNEDIKHPTIVTE
jgi:hypothetical protein